MSQSWFSSREANNTHEFKKEQNVSPTGLWEVGTRGRIPDPQAAILGREGMPRLRACSSDNEGSKGSICVPMKLNPQKARR
jgi:hypothetical protein